MSGTRLWHRFTRNAGLASALLTLVALGCEPTEDEETTPDANSADVAADAVLTATDVRPRDVQPPDAGRDAEPGTLDATSTDGGAVADAAPVDGGKTADAAPADGASRHDAATRDGAVMPDAAVLPADAVSRDLAVRDAAVADAAVLPADASPADVTIPADGASVGDVAPPDAACPGGELAEACNGLDDDCDGAIDEGVLNACGGCGPVPEEVCNGLDDDCDDATDEVEGAGEACVLDQGVCGRDGLLVCAPAAEALVCDALFVGSRQAATEPDVVDGPIALDGDLGLAGARNEDAQTGQVFVLAPDAVDDWGIRATLAADDGEPGDLFGASVALSGDRAVVGATGDDDGGPSAGAAYVFHRGADGGWVQEAKLTAADAVENASLGRRVAIAGHLALVSSTLGVGAVYVFARGADGTWAQEAKIVLADAAPGHGFGTYIALDGSRALFGVPGHGAVGAAYVFERAGPGEWQQAARLTSSDGRDGDRFGTHVDLDGDLAVVGATNHRGSRRFSGAAYVYRHRGPADWREEAKLTAGDAAHADQADRVTIDAGRVLLGAPRSDRAGLQSVGAVYVFRAVAGRWVQEPTLRPTPRANTEFGARVALTGGWALVSVPGAAEDEAALQAFRVATDADQDGRFDLTPPPDVCDEVDNDCDGATDEDLPLNRCGVCGPLPEEVCDGADNDCDDLVDEGVLNACGACGAPPVETCNEQDDDCDGQVDEAVPWHCGRPRPACSDAERCRCFGPNLRPADESPAACTHPHHINYGDPPGPTRWCQTGERPEPGDSVEEQVRQEFACEDGGAADVTTTRRCTVDAESRVVSTSRTCVEGFCGIDPDRQCEDDYSATVRYRGDSAVSWSQTDCSPFDCHTWSVDLTHDADGRLCIESHDYQAGADSGTWDVYYRYDDDGLSLSRVIDLNSDGTPDVYYCL